MCVKRPNPQEFIPKDTRSQADKCLEAVIVHNDAAIDLAHQRLIKINELEDRIGVLKNYLTNLDCEWEYTFGEKK